MSRPTAAGSLAGLSRLVLAPTTLSLKLLSLGDLQLKLAYHQDGPA